MGGAWSCLSDASDAEDFRPHGRPWGLKGRPQAVTEATLGRGTCHSFPACTNAVLVRLVDAADEIRQQQKRCEPAGWQNLLINTSLADGSDPSSLLQALAEGRCVLLETT